jgi:F0F1-type ATP synthase assembly protein I
MAKKRTLIDAARDPVYEKKRTGPQRKPPSRAKSARKLLVASISIAVGFVGGVLVGRYIRIF